jgi:hypothetical protein
MCTKARVKTLTTTEQPSKSDPLFDSMSTAAATLQRWWGDLLQSSGMVVLCGGVLALMLSMIWLVLMEHMAKTMVWVTIWFLYVILLSLTIYLYWEAGMVDLQQFGAFRTSASAFLQDSGLESAYASGSAAAGAGRNAAASSPIVRHRLTSSVEETWTHAQTAQVGAGDYGGGAGDYAGVVHTMRVLKEEYQAHDDDQPMPHHYASAAAATTADERSLTDEEDADSLSVGTGISADVATLGSDYQKVFAYAAYCSTFITVCVGLAIIFLRTR